MSKKYLSKIIANDNEGLQIISACCAGAEVKIGDVKYLKKNKVFLLSLRRSKIELEKKDKKVNSISITNSCIMIPLFLNIIC